MADVLRFPEPAGGSIAAASTCVFRANAVLIVKRAKPPFSWSLPGGRIEPGESARDAALRELGEETGICAEIIAKVGVLNITGSDGSSYSITNFAARYLSGDACAMSDASDVAWIRPDEVARYEMTANAGETIARARALLANRQT